MSSRWKEYYNRYESSPRGNKANELEDLKPEDMVLMDPSLEGAKPKVIDRWVPQSAEVYETYKQYMRKVDPLLEPVELLVENDKSKLPMELTARIATIYGWLNMVDSKRFPMPTTPLEAHEVLLIIGVMIQRGDLPVHELISEPVERELAEVVAASEARLDAEQAGDVAASVAEVAEPAVPTRRKDLPRFDFWDQVQVAVKRRTEDRSVGL